MRDSWCYDVSLDDWVLDVPNEYETIYFLCCEHIDLRSTSWIYASASFPFSSSKLENSPYWVVLRSKFLEPLLEEKPWSRNSWRCNWLWWIFTFGSVFLVFTQRGGTTWFIYGWYVSLERILINILRPKSIHDIYKSLKVMDPQISLTNVRYSW